MQCLALILIEHEFGDEAEKALAGMGFRKLLASEDKKLAFHLPYPAYAGMRDGESLEQVREAIMKDLKSRDLCAFVLITESFACGRV